MSEIIEHRWKCDYCGVVSPVFMDNYPKGWVFDYATHSTLDKHFCCAYHEILHKNKQTASAKTPEETTA